MKKTSVLKFCRCPVCRPRRRKAARNGHRKLRRMTKQALRTGREPPVKLSLGYLD